jgi:hypothetical protein
MPTDPTATAALRPIDVPCGECGVAKWENCRGTEAGTGYLAGTTEPHPSRVEAARATTTAAFGSPEYVAGVREGLTRLRVLTDEHGFNKGAVMFLTGLSADEVDDPGGVTDD